MKLLCASSSLAFVHPLRIALEGEGIESYCSDADASLSSIAGPMTGTAARLYVLNEEDWDRAVEIMKELDGPAQERAVVARKAPLPVWLVVGISALLVAMLVATLGNQS